MTCTCKICGTVIDAQPTGPHVPLLGDPNRGAVEYQAAIGALTGHVSQFHPDYAGLLAQTANTYMFHLIAKLAISSDPAFSDEREYARALCYWTLAGDIKFSSPASNLVPTR